MEQAANRGGQHVLFGPLWKFFQFTGQRTSNALGNMACQCCECLILIFRERSKFLAKNIQFLPAKFIESVTQGYDGGHYTLRHQFATKALHFRLHNLFRSFGSRLPAYSVALDDALEVVHVEQVNTLDFAHCRVDITRNRNINHDHRLAIAFFRNVFRFLAAEDDMRA